MGTTNPANFNATLALANGGTGQTTKQAAFDALSPLTTKGDILTYSTTPARLAVGANNTVLLADSTQTTGLRWGTPGTVTSVGISSSTLIIGSSPVTTSGTITIATPLSIAGNNLLINGDMQIIQAPNSGTKAVSFTGAATNYTLDMWQCQTGAATTVYIIQIAGATSGSFVAQVGRLDGDAGTAAILFAQTVVVDKCIGAASNIISLQFQAKYGSGYSSSANALTVKVYSGTGADKSGINGTFTGSSAAISTSVTLTASLAGYSASSSALGSTVTQLCVEFSYTPSGTASSDYLVITNVQLEISPQPTNYQYRSFGQQLQECQAYYSQSFNYGVAPAQNAGTGNGEYHSYMRSTLGAGSEALGWVTFPSYMRAVPTMTLYNPSAANAQVRNLGTAANWTACSFDQKTASGFSIIGTADAGSTVGNQLAFNWAADARLT